MKQTVVGLFDKQSDAQQAVEQLLNSGFSNDNVDISSGTLNTNSDSGYISSGSDYTSNANVGSTYAADTDAGRGYASGVNSGTGYSSGNTEHEGGIVKFFKNLFGDDDNDAQKYSRVASRSNSIVTVYAQSQEEAERATEILDDNDAVDVDEKANEYGYNQTESTGSEYNTTSGISNYDISNSNADTDKSIPIIEENLEVGKRTVQTGGVRLRSRIVERPVEESLRLRQEYVRVERTAVNRPATEADFNTFKEGEIEMKEHAEVPVVSKQARVVEEVSLGKDVNERNETISDTVRKTEVDVEDIEGDKTVTGKKTKRKNS